MPHELSIGAVVFKQGESERLFLLLNYAAGHWDFPKGHVEKGETEQQTLLREIKEETGLTDVRLLPGFRQSTNYYFKSSGQTIFKEVIFYLLEAVSGSVRISHEHKDSEWLPYEKALAQITFKNSRSVLEKANGFLGRNSKSAPQK